jgi:hypothetical protein
VIFEDDYDDGTDVDDPEFGGYINGDHSLRVDVDRGDTRTVLVLVDLPTHTSLYTVVLEGQPESPECVDTARR